MVGAVLAGDGLERVAEIAAAHAGAPVAVIVPRLGVPLEGWARYERYVGARLAGGRPQRPADVTAEVPISSGGRELGAVLLLGRGPAGRRRVPAHGGDRGAHRGRGGRGAGRDRAVAARLVPRGGCSRGRSSTRPTCSAGPPGSAATWAAASWRSAPTRTAAARAGWWRRWRPRCRARWPRPSRARSTRCCPGEPDLARRAAARLGRHADIGLSRPTAAARPRCAARSRRPSWCWA